MADRINQAQLERMVKRVNRLEGRPEATVRVNEDGSRAFNVGNLYIDGAYGGVAVCEMTSEGGTMSYHYPSGMGHVPKREVFIYLQGRLAGAESYAERQRDLDYLERYPEASPYDLAE